MLSAVFTPALWVIINKRCFLSSSHLLYLLLIFSSCSAFSFSLAHAKKKKKKKETAGAVILRHKVWLGTLVTFNLE